MSQEEFLRPLKDAAAEIIPDVAPAGCLNAGEVQATAHWFAQQQKQQRDGDKRSASDFER